MNKNVKIILYILGAIAITVVAYYALDSLTALFLPVIFGGKYVIDDLNKKEDKVKSEIKDIEKKQDDLKKDGVKDLTPDEEVDYWKNEWKDK